MQKKVLVISKIHPEGITELEKFALVDEKIGLSFDKISEIIDQYDAVVLRSGTDHLKHATVLEAGKRGKLRVVGLAQTGTDNVDLETAERLGIRVLNSNANDISTAELVLGLMFNLARHIIAAQQALLNGDWEDRNGSLLGIELSGKTLGIIGLGNIGQKVAKRAKGGIEMKIMAYNRNRENVANLASERGYILSSLDELLEKSDIITLHIPLTEETRNLINAAAIDRMKPTAFIINCARGGIVNEADLLKALESNRIAGAALDVFEQEPLPDNSPLREFARRSNKLYLSPHLGSGTYDAQRKVAIDVVRQICRYLCGEDL